MWEKRWNADCDRYIELTTNESHKHTEGMGKKRADLSHFGTLRFDLI